MGLPPLIQAASPNRSTAARPRRAGGEAQGEQLVEERPQEREPEADPQELPAPGGRRSWAAVASVTGDAVDLSAWPVADGHGATFLVRFSGCVFSLVESAGGQRSGASSLTGTDHGPDPDWLTVRSTSSTGRRGVRVEARRGRSGCQPMRTSEVRNERPAEDAVLKGGSGLGDLDRLAQRDDRQARRGWPAATARSAPRRCASQAGGESSSARRTMSAVATSNVAAAGRRAPSGAEAAVGLTLVGGRRWGPGGRDARRRRRG